MLVHLLLLMPFSYAIFVFTFGSFNLFVIPKEPFRKRDWRLGRAFALASLVAGILAIVMFHDYDLGMRSAVVAYLVLVALMVIPSFIRYRKSSIWR